MIESIRALFDELSDEDIAEMRTSGMIGERRFRKGETIYRAGDSVRAFGLVRAGSVHIENNDLWGKKTILSRIGRGEIFAESYAICGAAMMADAVAAEESDVLLFDLGRLLDERMENKAWYPKLLGNLMRMAARKNLLLSNRIFCMSAKSIRGRLYAYFSEYAAQQGCMEFDIPFTRQQLADYLNLDRSALSKELCRLRDEGVLAFHKNHFIIYALDESTARAPTGSLGSC